MVLCCDIIQSRERYKSIGGFTPPKGGMYHDDYGNINTDNSSYSNSQLGK